MAIGLSLNTNKTMKEKIKIMRKSRTHEVTRQLGLTNISDEEFDVFAQIKCGAGNLMAIDHMLTIIKSYNLMNRRRGQKIKLQKLIEEYINKKY